MEEDAAPGPAESLRRDTVAAARLDDQTLGPQAPEADVEERRGRVLCDGPLEGVGSRFELEHLDHEPHGEGADSGSVNEQIDLSCEKIHREVHDGGGDRMGGVAREHADGNCEGADHPKEQNVRHWRWAPHHESCVRLREAEKPSQAVTH